MSYSPRREQFLIFVQLAKRKAEELEDFGGEYSLGYSIVTAKLG